MGSDILVDVPGAREYVSDENEMAHVSYLLQERQAVIEDAKLLDYSTRTWKSFGGCALRFPFFKRLLLLS